MAESIGSTSTCSAGSKEPTRKCPQLVLPGDSSAHHRAEDPHTGTGTSHFLRTKAPGGASPSSGSGGVTGIVDVAEYSPLAVSGASSPGANDATTDTDGEESPNREGGGRRRVKIEENQPSSQPSSGLPTPRVQGSPAARSPYEALLDAFAAVDLGQYYTSQTTFSNTAGTGLLSNTTLMSTTRSGADAPQQGSSCSAPRSQLEGLVQHMTAFRIRYETIQHHMGVLPSNPLGSGGGSATTSTSSATTTTRPMPQPPSFGAGSPLLPVPAHAPGDCDGNHHYQQQQLPASPEGPAALASTSSSGPQRPVVAPHIATGTDKRPPASFHPPPQGPAPGGTTGAGAGAGPLASTLSLTATSYCDPLGSVTLPSPVKKSPVLAQSPLLAVNKGSFDALSKEMLVDYCWELHQAILRTLSSSGASGSTGTTAVASPAALPLAFSAAGGGTGSVLTPEPEGGTAGAGGHQRCDSPRLSPQDTSGLGPSISMRTRQTANVPPGSGAGSMLNAPSVLAGATASSSSFHPGASHTASAASLSALISNTTWRSSSTLSVQSLARPPVQVTETMTTELDEEGNKTVNQYLILDELGKGCFGTVKLAYDVEKERMVAMKVMKRSVGGKRGVGAACQVAFDNRAKAMQREIAVMKKLRHKNLVSLFEVIDDPESKKVFLILQYVDSGAVATMSDQFTCQPYSPVEVAGFARQICAGLQYLHDHEIVHRDIKPDNILRDCSENVYLADFGVSEMFDEDVDEELDDEEGEQRGSEGFDVEKPVSQNQKKKQPEGGGSSLLKRSVVVQGTKGTPAFMGPELLSVSLIPGTVSGSSNNDDKCSSGGDNPRNTSSGTEPNKKTREAEEEEERNKQNPFLPNDDEGFDGKALDVWALGITLYALLFGRLPFKTKEDICLAVLSIPPTTPDGEPVPKGWALLLKAMLQKDPSKRPEIAQVRSVIKQLQKSNSGRIFVNEKEGKVPTATASSGFFTEGDKQLSSAAFCPPVREETQEAKDFSEAPGKNRSPPPPLESLHLSEEEYIGGSQMTALPREGSAHSATRYSSSSPGGRSTSTRPPALNADDLSSPFRDPLPVIKERQQHQEEQLIDASEEDALALTALEMTLLSTTKKSSKKGAGDLSGQDAGTDALQKQHSLSGSQKDLGISEADLQLAFTPLARREPALDLTTSHGGSMSLSMSAASPFANTIRGIRKLRHNRQAGGDGGIADGRYPAPEESQSEFDMTYRTSGETSTETPIVMLESRGASARGSPRPRDEVYRRATLPPAEAGDDCLCPRLDSSAGKSPASDPSVASTRSFSSINDSSQAVPQAPRIRRRRSTLTYEQSPVGPLVSDSADFIMGRKQPAERLSESAHTPTTPTRRTLPGPLPTRPFAAQSSTDGTEDSRHCDVEGNGIDEEELKRREAEAEAAIAGHPLLALQRARCAGTTGTTGEGLEGSLSVVAASSIDAESAAQSLSLGLLSPQSNRAQQYASHPVHLSPSFRSTGTPDEAPRHERVRTLTHRESEKAAAPASQPGENEGQLSSGTNSFSL